MGNCVLDAVEARLVVPFFDGGLRAVCVLLRALLLLVFARLRTHMRVVHACVLPSNFEHQDFASRIPIANARFNNSRKVHAQSNESAHANRTRTHSNARQPIARIRNMYKATQRNQLRHNNYKTKSNCRPRCSSRSDRVGRHEHAVASSVLSDSQVRAHGGNVGLSGRDPAIRQNVDH